MAQVLYEGGVPQVSPDERPPDDYQHIQPTPDQFGGLIAKGEQQAGQGVEKAGETLFNAAQFEGRVNVDDQVNHWITTHNQILYGDPNKTTLGPDGKPVPDTGFYGLQGRSASDQRDATLKAIEDAREEGRKNLKSPQEQFEYDSQTRRMYADTQQRVGVHTDQQWKTWAGGTNEKGASLAMDSYLRNLNDPQAMSHSAADYINFKVQKAQIEFGDDPTVKRAVIDGAKRDLLKAQVQAVSVNDPSGAQRILEKNKAIAGPEYEPMANQLRTRAEQANGIDAAQRATTQAVQTARQRPTITTLPQLQGAILRQESGNRDNVAVSPTGAVGPGQVEPATFAQYARSGEVITNPSDNRAVSARILTDYWNRYQGDPQRVAVAYFSGPNNVAPQGSPTPWRVNRSDGRTTVAQYVSGVTGQQVGIMPNGKPAGDPYALHAQTLQNVMNDPNLNENERWHAEQFLNRSFTEATVAAEADAKAKRDTNDTATNDYVTAMIADPTKVPQIVQQMNSDGRITNPASKEGLYNFAKARFGFDDTMQYGTGYADAYKRIFLPPDDPQRINDANEILKLGAPGGSLTTTGTTELMKVFGASRKDPDQSAVNQAKSGLINYAKSKLSFDQEMLFPGVKPLADPKGVQAFDAVFIPKFEAAYAEWMKAGKNPWEFLTQENVDKLMTGIRPKAQMAADRVTAEGGATGEGLATAAPPAAPDGVKPEIWNGLLAKAPTMATGQVATPRQYGDAINLLAENPTDAVKAQFNKWFGAEGQNADDVLRKLGGPAASLPGAEGAVTGTVPVAPEPAKPWYQRLPSTLVPPELRAATQ